MNKKRIGAVICSMLLCTVMLSSNVVAAAPPSDDSTIAPQAEEFAWYFRIHNGIKQRRCWSITRGVWVTDWEDSPYS